MKLRELKIGVDKGSQSRANHPTATDDPDKYIGKWEAYDTPQGIGSQKKKKKKKATEGDASFGAGWAGRGGPSHQAPLPDEMFNIDHDEIKKSKKSPLKKAHADVKNTTNGMAAGITTLGEAIRRPEKVKLSGEYFIQDGKDDVGYALVHEGVISQISFNTQVNEKYAGEIVTKLLQLIVREADWINANLSTQIKNDSNVDVKRLLERFGFRYTEQGVMRRTAGSIIPPSAANPY